ncbi:efflux RND transporter permease subunit [Cucumibacter marinus]|uniref:efflux RND transporter permease subunit n=1 Tax=Cucumibacter marinus TaxID=1121252 RepID=UPI00040ADE1C|nr:MMPL family transporter [Cucumibacter marinus]
MSIGFGLERLGFITLKYPKVAGALVLAFTAFCFYMVPQMSTDGNLLRMYSGSGEQFENYEELRDTFGTFENDFYLLVHSDKLTDPEVLEEIRTIALDLALNEYAVGTLSPFSLRKPTEDPGTTVPAVPENMQTSEEVAAALNDLRENDPMMRNLILEDNKGMVLIMFPASEVGSVWNETDMIESLEELVAYYDSPDYTLQITGPPIWTKELLDASLQDQVKFTSIGMGLGFLIALVVFRSFWSAVIATTAPFISVFWVIGVVTTVFGSFTFLTNIVTALVLVIAFAESLYFCFYWLRLWNEGEDPHKAIRMTVERVSPACALTSITTLIAFSSLLLTQGQGIQEFAASGAIAVIIAFVALVTFLPLVLMLALKLGFKGVRSPSVAVTAIIPVAQFATNRGYKFLAALGIVLTVLLLYPHLTIEPRFSFRDYLPSNSQALETSKDIDQGVGGVSPIYISVPLEDAVADVTDKDFETIQTVHDIAESVFGENKVISAASFSHYSDSGFTRDQIFDAVGPFLKRRFITDDGQMALVTAFTPTSSSSTDIREQVIEAERLLEESGVEGAKVAGFRVLSAFASVDMIQSLQNGLTIAVIVAIGVIGLAFRSWKVAVVSIVPNFLPILGTEFYLWISGTGLQITTVISLTIAFGIAVDDTIHFLAHYKRARDEGLDAVEAVDRTLVRVGPALVATTLILCVGCSVVMFSALPQVALFGTLTVLTLVLALIGDLFILPAVLVAGGRIFGKVGGKN